MDIIKRRNMPNEKNSSEEKSFSIHRTSIIFKVASFSIFQDDRKKIFQKREKIIKKEFFLQAQNYFNYNLIMN